ncbi:MAG: hypothetical protein ACPG5U_05225 [Planktomarina sp.]
MMGPIWFVRMARWVKNPPSKKMVYLVIGITLSAAALIGIEQFVGWPDWLTFDNRGFRNQGVGNAVPLD